MARNQGLQVDEDEEEVIPRPAALIEALRSFGYTPATAVADLLDNSITAGAEKIDVEFTWAGRESHVTIRDDGCGMSEEVLSNAMRAGSQSPLDERDPKDLGRFGLGLKTASFSQARSLTVFTKTSRRGPVAVRRWDLDHVQQTDRWSLKKSASQKGDELASPIDTMTHGTLVVWEKLDRIVGNAIAEDEKARDTFLTTVAQIKEHLEMVFHQLLEEDDLTITVNGQLCEPWDPFMTKERRRQAQPDESKTVTLPDGSTETLTIRPWIMPHHSQLTTEAHRRGAGPRGWNLQQGFYLYRGRRLIVAGDWFDPKLKPEEHYKLGRIRVEISQNMDHAWDLDVRKSRARPPSELREEFTRIARANRKHAQEVYRTVGPRGPKSARRTEVEPVWQFDRSEDRIRYRINREHPHVKGALQRTTGAGRRSVRALLGLVERTVPLTHILSHGFSDEQSISEDHGEPDEDLIWLTRSIFESLCVDNTEELAREILLSLQPFDAFPQIIRALTLETES